MNAFTRQEIKAIAPKKVNQTWMSGWANASKHVYQPVIDFKSRRVAAYYAKLNLTESVEDSLRSIIEKSPTGRPLLITLDCRQLLNEQGLSSGLVSFLQHYLWSERELVFHLECSPLCTCDLMQMYKRIQRAGVPTMVDSSASWDLDSIRILLDASIIRFTPTCLSESLLVMTRRLGIQTMLAEIESARMHDAQKLGFDWMQVAC